MSAPDQGDPPTINWTCDFDILNEGYIREPEVVWRDLRQRCPIAFSERRGRTWLPVRYDDIAAIAHATERFSSANIGVIDLPKREGRPNFEAPPITSDPPTHTWARRLLLPAFAPRRIEQLTPITVELADELLDELAPRHAADAATEYAQHIPIRVISHMLGVPRDDETLFAEWAVKILQDGFHNLQNTLDTMGEVLRYFAEKIQDRRQVPEGERPDDLITLLIESEVEAEPLDDRHLLGTCFLLLIAGMDTTWSALASSIWHLASNPVDQERLRAEPQLIPTAVEEFLRMYSPVTMAREVTQDIEFGGCPMRKGDKVLMAFPAGNRDPARFDNPDEFIIDREQNRHFAFGAGVHRCLGSNLARMEMAVGLERWLARIPPFEIVDPEAVTWTGGQVRGPRTIPLTW